MPRLPLATKSMDSSLRSLDTLNASQRDGVLAQGHCLISAGPGSGKTRVLAARAAHLLEREPQARVCAVTFTADAAKELDERIRASCPAEAGKRLYTGTFHSLCLRQLKRARRSVRLANEFQSRDFIRRAHGLVAPEDATFDDALDYVQARKASRERPPVACPETARELEAVFARYQTMLQEAKLRDFADLILDAVDGMADGSIPGVPARFMLVDEFQDSDPIQLEWVLAHVALGTEVTVVGDDDQSIYGWRHAMGYEGMRTFLARTRGQHVNLGTSYRCAPQILGASQKLIVNNTHRVEKSLRTASRSQGRIRLVRTAGSTDSKADSRSGEIREMATTIKHGGTPGEWAVLARTNAILNEVEIGLTGLGVMCKRLGGKSFWSSRYAALYLDLIRSVSGRHRAGVEMALSTSGVRPTDIERLRHINLYTVTKTQAAQAGLSPASVEKVRTLADRLREWGALARDGKESLACFGAAEWLNENTRTAFPFETCATTLVALEGSLGQRAAWVERARNSVSQHDGDDTPGMVTLATLHASKGLEWPRVWIMSCHDGVIPHHDSPLEEERRLMYVGMTRAKIELVLSISLGKGMSPSPFLDEAGVLAIEGAARARTA